MNFPPGANGNLISVAVNSDGIWKETPLAVDASATENEYNLILIKLSSSTPATQDIHVTLVPVLDSLTTFNHRTFDVVDPKTGKVTLHPEKYYVAPGSTGAPAFSVVDNGVAIIPKGSYYGYMKIKTVSADYFGAVPFAFAYRISSVQESGYVISENNGYSITHFIPKNPYDGTYSYTGVMVRKNSDGTPVDATDGTIVDGVTVDLVTTGLTTDTFKPVWADNGSSVGGIGTPEITINPDNTITVVPKNASPANWAPIPSLDNKYDPATKTFYINYKWSGALAGSPSGTTRGMMLKLVYQGPRK
ncbi:MAG: DUF4361 domain-containing protein [Cyclobacteriaceae bacterium]